MRMLTGALCAALIGVLPACAHGPETREETAAKTERSQQSVVVSQAELDRLHQEIRQLRRENRALREGRSAPVAESTRPERTAAAASTPTVHGKLTAVAPLFVEVTQPNGEVMRLHVDVASEATENGQPVPFRELPEGRSVRASYVLIGGVPHVRALKVIEKK